MTDDEKKQSQKIEDTESQKTLETTPSQEESSKKEETSKQEKKSSKKKDFSKNVKKESLSKKESKAKTDEEKREEVKSKILAELETLGDEALKQKLEELNTLKEEWFTKKEELKQKIADMIDEAKKLRSDKDSFKKKIDELKIKRDKFNVDVQEMVKKIKGLNQQKQDKFLKLGLEKINPSFLKKQLETLELDLETQAVSFDKEKKIMKQINALRKKLASMTEVKEVLDAVEEISLKINEAKQKGDEFHNKIRNYVKEHKDDYKSFTKLSKEINKFKKIQEDAFEKFITFKQAFLEANLVFKKRLGNVKDGRKKERKRKEEKQKVRKEKDQEMIEEKAQQVEEKLKKKKILTTEDLIAYQAKSE